MILAVCLNPAVDVTYAVPDLLPGASHRVRGVRRRPGGKGVNVAAVLTAQGSEAVLTAPVGGSAGRELTDGLDDLAIPHRLVPIGAPIRETVTVMSAQGATVLNEPGPVLTTAEWRAFTTSFEQLLSTVQVVTLSGSLPGGVGSDAYAELIDLAHRHDVPVILDCAGEALLAALTVAPDVLKINDDEAAAAVGASADDAGQVFQAAEDLHARGAAEVVITRGEEGVAALIRDHRLIIAETPRLPGNPTGAGDAFTAGLAATTAAGKPWPQRLRTAAGWAAGAVARPVAGEVDPRVAEHVGAQLDVEEFVP